MRSLARPHAAVVVPILFLLCAAGLFLLVALSITVQPESPGREPGARTLDVLRALFFAAAGFAFFTSLAGFARRNLVAARQPVERPLPVRSARPKPAPLAVAEDEEVEPMRFTLVALDSQTRETRAILDYDSSESLLEALTLWRRRHPEEEVHVFGPDGVEIASRRAAAVPEAEAHFVTPLVRRTRPQLAVGGV